MNIRKNVHIAACLVSGAMLLVALLPVPHWYYLLLKITIFVVALHALHFQWSSTPKAFSAWLIFSLALAVLFNPFIQPVLARDIWVIVDVFGAIALFSYAWTSKRLP